jgi:hypothetical protein
MYLQYENIYNFQESNWIEFYVLLGNLSKNIRTKDKSLEKNLITTIFHILCFAKQNNIDMNASWNRWKVKCDYKSYY